MLPRSHTLRMWETQIKFFPLYKKLQIPISPLQEVPHLPA